MGSLANNKTILTSAVANNGTVTVGYPVGFDQAKLTGSTGGVAAVDGDTFPQAASGAGTVGIDFGASNITITNRSGITWRVGAELIVSYGRIDIAGSYNLTNPRQVQEKAAALA